MPTPLIIDTDPGVDDAVAILLALRSPEVDVRAVTVAFGNVGIEHTLPNARKLVALAGRHDVPVAAGAARPLVHPRAEQAGDVHGADGLGGRAAELTALAPLDPRPAVEVMAAVLREASEPVTVASIGPATNSAVLLAAHPELAGRIGRFVVMGGALSGGNITGAAEFNVHCDPEAMQRLLTQADVPVTMVPLDLTLRCAAGGEWVERLAAGGPVGATLAGIIASYRAVYSKYFGRDAVAVHDAVALLEAIHPGVLRTTPLPIQVACDLGPARGATVPNRRADAAGPPVHVALDADIPAVLDDIATRLTD
ncbi:nucleoside hydrolase [Pseudonocardia ailaonensis]|uniref:Nucleoside hydrolase n=1 Tax=Pseudonocardia ailaonensis TaxID=367279 RepID=A0ABN2NCR0_9PSEU